MGLRVCPTVVMTYYSYHKSFFGIEIPVVKKLSLKLKVFKRWDFA